MSKRDKLLYGAIGFAVTNPGTKTAIISVNWQRAKMLWTETVMAIPLEFLRRSNKWSLVVGLVNDSTIEFHTTSADLRGFHIDAVKIDRAESPEQYIPGAVIL